MPKVAASSSAAAEDVDTVRLVVNFRLPQTVESFTHRVGRTGRAGRAGRARSSTSPTSAR